MFEIEISTKKGFKDSRGEHVLSDIRGISVAGVSKVAYSQIYLIDADVNAADANLAASELLSDKITETYSVKSFVNPTANEPVSLGEPSVIEVWYKKGVTDTVAESVVKAVKDLGIKKSITVKTGHRYYLSGKLSKKTLDTIATKLLANTIIQDYKVK
ncbi:phosphoribosylformylglycinamidine synthase subunit PurS [Endomicrobium proavitum]|uniref:Factor required for phosphoribosylformylglycinamidine synthetase activity n=1 Tax=Endomicrobium proavitum TaxID=1408281 RepID=A0A0G3WHB9_9BACT|nr:phosphoribosylformylglycinamidine synthase subunit PurS [Endomicrobium proavitum]AKL98021.1 factor required for phosphoribosylformylglycinamidine synthetase activity [Endomicrobium proavitum]